MTVHNILQNCGFNSVNHVQNAVKVANQTATINQIRACAVEGLEADLLAKLIPGKKDFLATLPIDTGTGVTRTLPVGSGYDDDDGTSVVSSTSTFF